MLIYPEAGALHADYSDGDHVIHYSSSQIVSGQSVVFTTAPQPARPTFRLTYEMSSTDTLAVRFEIAPSGDSAFHSIATATLRKSS